MLLSRLKHIPIVIILFSLLFPSLLSAGFYKWVDEQGKVHFTDNYHNIPEKYRNKVSQSKHGKKEELKSLSKNTPQRVVVHFKRKDNAIFINAILDWKLPVVFHMDTGATSTMITRQDALALGIDPDNIPKVKGYIADGSVVEFPRTVLSSISVGDAEVNSVEVAIGNMRLLGMNFLNAFKVNIDAENGQLILERKDLVKEIESPSVRAEKNHTIVELENQIEQIGIAINAKENVIKQIESDVQRSEEKRAKVETILKGVQERTRFEGSDISSDSSKQRKIDRCEDAIAEIDRHIEIRRNEIEIHQKQIEQLGEKVTHYETLIDKLR
jgi:clan AA aspartic protease (TIGR02281 family)